MKILQFSDLHLTKGMDTSRYRAIIDLMPKKLESFLDEGEALVLCLCGDVFNKGSICQEEANSFLEYLKEKLKKYEIKILIVPGNHDAVSTNAWHFFLQLVKSFFSKDTKVSKRPINPIYATTAHRGTMRRLLNTDSGHFCNSREGVLPAFQENLQGGFFQRRAIDRFVD